MRSLNNDQRKRLMRICAQDRELAISHRHFYSDDTWHINDRDLGPMMLAGVVEGFCILGSDPLIRIKGILDEKDWSGNTIDVEEVIWRYYRYVSDGKLRDTKDNLLVHKRFLQLYLTIRFEDVRGGLIFISSNEGGGK